MFVFNLSSLSSNSYVSLLPDGPAVALLGGQAVGQGVMLALWFLGAAKKCEGQKRRCFRPWKSRREAGSLSACGFGKRQHRVSAGD